METKLQPILAVGCLRHTCLHNGHVTGCETNCWLHILWGMLYQERLEQFMSPNLPGVPGYLLLTPYIRLSVPRCRLT